jgi:hypothetical protein
MRRDLLFGGTLIGFLFEKTKDGPDAIQTFQDQEK